MWIDWYIKDSQFDQSQSRISSSIARVFFGSRWRMKQRMLCLIAVVTDRLRMELHLSFTLSFRVTAVEDMLSFFIARWVFLGFSATKEPSCVCSLWVVILRVTLEGKLTMVLGWMLTDWDDHVLVTFLDRTICTTFLSLEQKFPARCRLQHDSLLRSADLFAQVWFRWVFHLLANELLAHASAITTHSAMSLSIVIFQRVWCEVIRWWRLVVLAWDAPPLWSTTLSQ